MLLLDSLYINNSGGKVLLDYLVEELERSDIDVFYLFDERCKNDYQWVPKERRTYMKASLINRYKFYKKHKNNFSKVLCFGNIPPPIGLDYSVFTYFHNVSLLLQPNNYSLRETLLKKIKLLVIKMLNRRGNVFIVQSENVKKMLRLEFKNNKIEVLPFFRVSNRIKTSVEKEESTFVYISNGNTHKNHFKLFKTWEILAAEGLYPKLHLTITENYENHLKEITRLQESHIQIINHGFCNPEELYKVSKYLIYPSLTESFGLGLIEGIEYHCEVLASDLDYVYEVCQPLITFDPNNELNIANSVRKVLMEDENRPYMTKAIIRNKIDQLLMLIR